MSPAPATAPAPARMGRRAALGAALAALLMVGVAIIGSQPAARAANGVMAAAGDLGIAAPGIAPLAAPLAAAGTVVPGPDGPLTLEVTPAAELAPSGAEITVRGSGFDTDTSLWIAVCQDDGAAPQSLQHCVGGAIPDSNATSAWGVVNEDGEAPRPGPVSAAWQDGGSFVITLRVRSAAGQDADCLSAACSVYVRSADGSDRRQDVRVPVQFRAPAGRTSESPPPATQTIGVVVTTATPETVASTSVAVGGEQTVVFAGFTPGEVVDVALYSDPIPLHTAQADSGGVVTITFPVPDDLPFGVHLVQAIGRESGRIGVARFTVGAPVTTTAASGATSPAMTASTAAPTLPGDTTPARTAQGPGGADNGGVLDTTPVTPQGAASSEVSTSTVHTSARESTSTSATIPQVSGPYISRLAWLLIALGVLAVLAAVAGVIVMMRRRKATN